MWLVRGGIIMMSKGHNGHNGHEGHNGTPYFRSVVYSHSERSKNQQKFRHLNSLFSGNKEFGKDILHVAVALLKYSFQVIILFLFKKEGHRSAIIASGRYVRYSDGDNL